MMKNEATREAVLSTPPVSVVGLSLAGVSLQDWVLIGTLVWLGMQISWFGYARYKEWRNKGKE